jgi:spore coat polysaccharide biosynthesis protein SpsF
VRIAAITQARLSSSRLPGKVLKPLGSTTVLGMHLARIKEVSCIELFIVAAAIEEGNEKIQVIAQENGFQFFAGDKDDVLDRFYQAVKDKGVDAVIRLTSDCPLIDSGYIKDLIKKFEAAQVDYASNCIVPNLPDGMDAEIFTFNALEIAWKNAQLKSEREHVTPFIRNSGQFKILSLNYNLGLEDLRLTLDTEADYRMLDELIKVCGEKGALLDYVNCLDANPKIKKINSNIERNEGYQKSLKGDS